MITRYQQNVQALLLYPLQRGRFPFALNILDERISARKQQVLYCSLSLSTISNIFFDVEKYMCLDETPRSPQSCGKRSGHEAEFND